MNQAIEAKNKALVLEAFDTLFNKRDYAAAERYWFCWTLRVIRVIAGLRLRWTLRHLEPSFRD
jgi:hypothetical protein